MMTLICAKAVVHDLNVPLPHWRIRSLRELQIVTVILS